MKESEQTHENATRGGKNKSRQARCDPFFFLVSVWPRRLVFSHPYERVVVVRSPFSSCSSPHPLSVVTFGSRRTISLPSHLSTSPIPLSVSLFSLLSLQILCLDLSLPHPLSFSFCVPRPFFFFLTAPLYHIPLPNVFLRPLCNTLIPSVASWTDSLSRNFAQWTTNFLRNLFSVSLLSLRGCEPVLSRRVETRGGVYSKYDCQLITVVEIEMGEIARDEPVIRVLTSPSCK